MTNAAGTAVTLKAGDYEAVLFSVGAAIGAIKYQGRDIVAADAGDTPSAGFKGKALLPWPNRIADGKYTFDGKNYEVPITEHDKNAALHGLACWTDWQITSMDTTSVAFKTTVAASPGYPWTLEAQTTYKLDAETGLTCSIVARNIGEGTAPYGVSSHPYITCNNAPIDNCELTVPAAQVLEVDENLKPVALTGVHEANLDYRTPHAISGQEIDHAFTELPEDSWAVKLHDPASGQTVCVAATAPWVQVYSGSNIGRLGVAVEPMTCPPNAFNSHEDLVLLAPGDESHFEFTIFEV